MSNFKWIFVIFCVILWTISSTTAQTARCDYSYKYHWTTEYKTTNASYYVCELDTKQANNNEKLTIIDGQHLTGHTDAAIKFIDINKGKLSKLSSIFCEKFPNLEVITIKDVKLDSIDEDSLINCHNLNHLLFFDNKLRKIPQNLLTENSKLTILWIRKNQLTTLPENIFAGQQELVTLILNNNEISSLPSNIFHPLVSLEVLYLYNNKLQSINPEWFETLQNLRTISLKGNYISKVPSNCFESLISLRMLLLHENRIKTLNSDSFDDLQNLQTLTLFSNQISELPVDVFTPLRNIIELSIFGNKLATIHSDSFGIHNQLTRVFLQNNKINSIDSKFIDNTAVSVLNMTNNICSQLDAKTRSDIKPNLKKCFDNYQSRLQPQNQSNKFQLPTKQISTCGKSKIGHGNIIGGTHINSGDYPWIAALLTPAGKFFCGGTVVSSRKVVTAAHCIQEKRTFDRLSASDLIVILGMYDLNDAIEIGRAIHAVYSINVHPDWNTLTQAHDADIAVLVLEKEVIFNERIQPICLPVPNSNVARILTGVVVGYGKSEDDTKEHENIPKIIATPIHSNDDCFAANEDLINLSSGRTFCGGSGRGVGVCNGDSGSGLIVSDGNAYYLRGVVSSSLFNSYKACDVDSYAIFTNVLKFVDWINGIPTDRFAVHHKK